MPGLVIRRAMVRSSCRLGPEHELARRPEGSEAAAARGSGSCRCRREADWARAGAHQRARWHEKETNAVTCAFCVTDPLLLLLLAAANPSKSTPDDYDPSSATSLLDLQPDIPHDEEQTKLCKTHCLFKLETIYIFLPSCDRSGNNCCC